MTINRPAMQEAIKCPNWQLLRAALKGRPTIIKLETCLKYIKPAGWSDQNKPPFGFSSVLQVEKTCCTYEQRCLQALNYLTALSRGGLIYPIPRSWQWHDLVERYLTEESERKFRNMIKES